MKLSEISTRKLFVTGTDTGVGKTYVTAGLVRAWRAAGRRAAGMKPFCSGGREDGVALWEAAGREIALDEVNPVWFTTPAAPLVAARREGRVADVAGALEAWRRLDAEWSWLLVEGAGGWLAPIAENFTVSDLARQVGYPVLVVARNRLGAVNHALLTVRQVLVDGLECAGVWLNHPQAATDAEEATALATNAALLAEFLPAGVRVLGETAFGESPTEVGG